MGNVKYCSKPRKTRCKQANREKRAAGIKPGMPYYYWTMKRAGRWTRCYSATEPKPSQLTPCKFKSAFRRIQEDLLRSFRIGHEDGEVDTDVVRGEVGELLSKMIELQDEQREKHNNMPYHLKDSRAAEILMDWVEKCQEWVDAVKNAGDDIGELRRLATQRIV